jgi:hypothetical protein
MASVALAKIELRLFLDIAATTEQQDEKVWKITIEPGRNP